MKFSASLLPLLALCALPASADEAPKPPPRCISTQDISNIEVVDDYTILFHMAGGKIWKNTLQSQCHGLGFERAIAYETWGGDLCGNAQVIHVLRRGSFCVLGPFETYSKPPKADEGSSSQ